LPEKTIFYGYYSGSDLRFSLSGLLRNVEYIGGVIAIGADGKETSAYGFFTSLTGSIRTGALYYEENLSQF
jgi:hypothetical protein